MIFIACVLFIIISLFQNVIRKVEASKTDGRDRPSQDVVIVNSGAEDVEPFAVTKDDATA